MKLHALLCFYDAPQSWLAATVASLAKIGVDNLIAVDGRFEHFEGETVNSHFKQIETINLVCESLGMGLTMIQPQEPWYGEHGGEVAKRNFMFKIAETIGEKFEDWLFIIDDDEVIIEGSPIVKRELEEAVYDVGMARMVVKNDPLSSDQDKEVQIARTIATNTLVGDQQTRFFRIMDNMTVEYAHYIYTANNREGDKVELRGVVWAREELGLKHAEIQMPQAMPVIEHRFMFRDAYRRSTKKNYYDLRDDIGLEFLESQRVVEPLRKSLNL